jgi:hypothetical protein
MCHMANGSRSERRKVDGEIARTSIHPYFGLLYRGESSWNYVMSVQRGRATMYDMSWSHWNLKSELSLRRLESRSECWDWNETCQRSRIVPPSSKKHSEWCRCTACRESRAFDECWMKRQWISSKQIIKVINTMPRQKSVRTLLALATRSVTMIKWISQRANCLLGGRKLAENLNICGDNSERTWHIAKQTPASSDSVCDSIVNLYLDVCTKFVAR